MERPHSPGRMCVNSISRVWCNGQPWAQCSWSPQATLQDSRCTSIGKPGAYLLRHSRRLQWAFLRRAWWRLFFIPVALLPITLVGLVFFPDLRQFVLGAAGASVVWLIVWALYTLDGGQNMRAGAGAERLTADCLKRLRREGWSIHHNVPREGRDVDHAIVGPRGVIAVESKYTNNEWRVSQAGIEEIKLSGWIDPLRWPLECARRAAGDLTSIIHAQPGRLRVSVLPLLVLWGPRVHGIPGGAVMIEGVLVATGAQAKKWLPRLAAHSLADNEVARARESIINRIEQHVPRAA